MVSERGEGRSPDSRTTLSLSRLWLPEAKLTAEESASTLVRFFRSEHVRDLRLIVYSTVLLFVIFILLVLAITLTSFGNLLSGTPPVSLRYGAPRADVFAFVTGYIGPAVGVAGLIVSWAYRSASARLGVVDLFACEISTLCRVGTIMDVGTRYVQQYDHPPEISAGAEKQQAPNFTAFTSQEDYFPILQTNARDLQILEALVVKDITEFYTYMKATRDTLRRLALLKVTRNPGAPSVGGPEFDAWNSALTDVIYMLFLAYESGRKAIERLIEFQPTRAEARIVILLTEIKCYSFLMKRYDPTDLRHQRLDLRKRDYHLIIEELQGQVQRARQEDKRAWAGAAAAIAELLTRYAAI